jgi:tetratricopeptide (TPR) repeat protein
MRITNRNRKWDNQLEASIASAEKFEIAGNLEAALKAWEKISCDEASEYYFRRYGRVAQKLKRWQTAEDAYSRALELDPLSVTTLELMGDLWARRTDKDERSSLQTARDWLLRAVADEKHTRLFTELGAVYQALGQTEPAQVAFEEALSLDGNNEEAMCDLALLLERADPLRAFGLLQSAIDRDPDYSVAHQALGRLAQQNGDLVRAEYEYDRCLEINPSDYWSLLYRANLSAVAGRNTEAIAFYERALIAEPTVASGYELFSAFLESIGMQGKAADIKATLSGK